MISGERNNSFEGEGLAAFVSFFTYIYFFEYQEVLGRNHSM